MVSTPTLQPSVGGSAGCSICGLSCIDASVYSPAHSLMLYCHTQRLAISAMLTFTHAPHQQCAAGQPTAPQSVHIASAGEDKLTVTWDAPLTDTPASYTVRLYSATEAFSGSVAAEWTGLSWNNQPMPSQGFLSIPGDEQTGYAFTTPALTLPLGKLPQWHHRQLHGS